MYKVPSFKNYVALKEQEEEGQSGQGGGAKDWKKEFISLEKGFIPPTKLRPVVQAFLDSGDIKIMDDTTKPVTMQKKPLFLVGGAVRDFIKGKAIKDYDLATPAMPSQIALILSSAGFTMSPERTGAEGEPLKLHFKPKMSKPGDKKQWAVTGRDQKGKPFVITAVVDGEGFEIATFRRDAKVTDGAATVDFVNNPHEDASRRDLTINAMFIELTSADGENKRLYDPTGKGYHDVRNNIVRTVGKARDRFDEDKLRIMRAVRFHSRYGKGEKMDPDIEHALPDFLNLRGVALERIRDEFLKGLLHPDTDVARYLKILERTGLMKKVFPGLEIHLDVPPEWSSRRDKPLSLAWILQGNPVDKVEAAMAQMRQVGQESDIPTGWLNQERRAVSFLLKLLEFTPQERPAMLRRMRGTGLSPEQVRNWVNMFRVNDHGTRIRDRRPTWARHVRAFADNDQPLARWDDVMSSGGDRCKNCEGEGCAFCGGSGKLPAHMRGRSVDDLEVARFMDILGQE